MTSHIYIATACLVFGNIFNLYGDTNQGEKAFSALEVISKEGMLEIADGSSTYTFRKDGSFVSMPMGISGRTIEGKWKSLSIPPDLTASIVVEGKWSWINGISSQNDFRTMTFWIYPLYRDKLNPKISKCYFLIDELKKKS